MSSMEPDEGTQADADAPRPDKLEAANAEDEPRLDEADAPRLDEADAPRLDADEGARRADAPRLD
jgi:hypothetical protein